MENIIGNDFNLTSLSEQQIERLSYLESEIIKLL